MLKSLHIGFRQHRLIDFERDSNALIALRDVFIDVDPRRKVPGLWLDVLEGLCSLYDGPGVNLAITECVTEFKPNGCILPVSRI